jgi:hypothetical protein
MAQNRANHPKQLEPGLNAIFGDGYKAVVGEHTVLFDKETSGRAFEEEVMVSGFGAAKVKAEGAGMEFDDTQETYTARYTHETISLGFVITEEAQEDNLYVNYAKTASKGLGRACGETKETKAANIFNRGFNSSYNGGDGVPLFSAAHPTRSGNQSNTVSADLSEQSLENAIIAIGDYRDERGLLISVKPKSLHIPLELQFEAHKILKSSLSPTVFTDNSAYATNTNKANALKDKGFFQNGAMVNHRFTDSNAWFIRTSAENGTKCFKRVGMQTQMKEDFLTGNAMYKVRERYSFGWSDWRQWYGSNGAS